MKRIAGALLFVPLTLTLVYFSTPFIFYLTVSVVVAICLVEFYRLREKGGAKPFMYMGVFLGLLVVFGFYYGEQPLTAFIISAVTIALFIRTLLGKVDANTAFRSASSTLVGILLIAWLLGHLIPLHKMENGKFYIIFLFFIAWFGDTAAYYIGKNFGRHKLAPTISPGKTIEGAIAGLGGSLTGAYVARWWFLRQVSTTDAFILGTILGVMGQLGDLTESIIKRGASAKDSGRLIPGHGGLLDRLDSLLFSAPILYYYVITIY